MSSKIIVDTIEKKTGDDVTLVGNLDVPTSYKITGTDADSIQAPGLITSAGGGLNTSLNTGLASATYNGTIGSSATFPEGHAIKVTPVIRHSTALQLSDNTITSAAYVNYTCVSSSNKILLLGVGVIGRGTQNGEGALYYYLDGTIIKVNQNIF